MEAVKSSITGGIRAQRYSWWSITVTGDCVSGAHCTTALQLLCERQFSKPHICPRVTSKGKRDVAYFRATKVVSDPPPRQSAQFFCFPVDCFPPSSISAVPKGECKQVWQQSDKSLQIIGVLGMTRGHKMCQPATERSSSSKENVSSFRRRTCFQWKGNWAEREHMTLHMSRFASLGQ